MYFIPVGALKWQIMEVIILPAAKYSEPYVSILFSSYNLHLFSCPCRDTSAQQFQKTVSFHLCGTSCTAAGFLTSHHDFLPCTHEEGIMH